MSMMYGVDVDSNNLHFATAVNGIGNGLDGQIGYFVYNHPDTRLVIVDTLQKIRDNDGEGYSYANDYEIIGDLKKIADRHAICVLVVHHTRKQPAKDNFEMISGTTGLFGCADGALVMQKERRDSLDAIVAVVGRDNQDQILYLRKDPITQIWDLVRTETDIYIDAPDPILEAVASLVSEDEPMWTGSPSELAEAIHTDMAANTLTKYLNVKCSKMINDYDVNYENKAKHAGRCIILTHLKTKD